MPQAKRKPTANTTDPAATTPATTTTTATAPPEPATATATATVTLKPTRGTLPTHTLPAPVPVATTSMHDLKAAYAAAAGLASADRIKVLYARKPVGDVKTIKEVLPAGALEGADGRPLAVELSVMVMGGGGGGGGGGTPTTAGTPAISTPERVASPAAAAVEMGEAPVAAGPSETAEILKTDEFWGDLKGFLVQRLKDEREGERLAGVFREALQKSGA